MKWEWLVPIGHADQKSELFKPKTPVSIMTVWKEQLEVGQRGVYFCAAIVQSVGPGRNHLVIYSHSSPIYKAYFPSSAETLWS